MKTLQAAHKTGPKTTLKPTPTTLLKLIYTGRNIRPSDLLSQAIDTLLLDMLQKLFPVEYVRAGTMEDIRLFAAGLNDAQLRHLGVPEGYWWHLRNLPEVSIEIKVLEGRFCSVLMR